MGRFLSRVVGSCRVLVERGGRLRRGLGSAGRHVNRFAAVRRALGGSVIITRRTTRRMGHGTRGRTGLVVGRTRGGTSEVIGRSLSGTEGVTLSVRSLGGRSGMFQAHFGVLIRTRLSVLGGSS